MNNILPCPFCGATLVERGDYSDTDAWNWWQHPEENSCIIGDIKIGISWDGQTADEKKWNTRTN